ncbi:MAG: family 43 glycosylhydrolase [Bacteroidales bacterium]|nr:family 43 glycosylhydrolase [Bacteroidales bacterium]
MKPTSRLLAAPALAAALLCLVSSSCRKTSGEPVFYENPVVRATAPDPSVIRAEDGTFYLYATGQGYSIFRSNNMVDWVKVGKVFSDENYPSLVRNNRKASLWAPEIRKIKDKYVLFYTLWFGTEWLSAIGYATADGPDGPFKDQGILIDSREVDVEQSIDQFYFEDKGKSYLFWGSFRNIYAVELNVTDDVVITPDLDTKVQVAGNAFEGTNIFKRGRYYYFFASTGDYSGGEKSTYRTVVARSKNVLGPYVDRNGVSVMDNGFEEVLDRNGKFSGPGHNAGLVVDDAGQTWMYYHAYQLSNLRLQRQGMLDKVEWTRDGWPYIAGGKPSARAEAPVVKDITVTEIEPEPDLDARYAVDMLPKGTPAPAFTLKDPKGRNVSLADFKGRYVVLDFWASWCPDCRNDVPELKKLFNEYASDRISFLSVSFDTEKEKWTGFIKDNGMDWNHVSPLAKWKDTKVSQDYKVNWIPSMYLIDSEGNVVFGTVMIEKMAKALKGLSL